MDTVLRTLGKIAMHTNTQSVVDYPLNETNRDHLCTTLIEFNLKISAIFIVSRPIKKYNHNKHIKHNDNNNNEDNTFHHWELRIIASPILISIGFVECNKKGAFRLNQTMSNDDDLKDFLFYYINSKRYKFDIVTCVIPNNKFDDNNNDNLLLLKRYLKKEINIKKKVCDIACFIEMWSENKKYNAISNNC